VWLNGHEWATRQAERAGIACTALSNGFAGCDQPRSLQVICDRVGPADVQAFFDRWIALLPTPFTAADRTAGGPARAVPPAQRSSSASTSPTQEKANEPEPCAARSAPRPRHPRTRRQRIHPKRTPRPRRRMKKPVTTSRVSRTKKG
jgi:hypothetical protein